jgi:hypothetical protein
MLKKSNQPMPSKVHDLVDANDDNDDTLAKDYKFQLSSML